MTHEQVLLRWDEDQFPMQPVNGRPAYPYMDDEQRKVARDAYVAWQGSRCPAPWEYAGQEVWVRDDRRDIEVRYGAERIAAHTQAVRLHQVVTRRRTSPRYSARGGSTFGQDADPY